MALFPTAGEGESGLLTPIPGGHSFEQGSAGAPPSDLREILQELYSRSPAPMEVAAWMAPGGPAVTSGGARGSGMTGQARHSAPAVPDAHATAAAAAVAAAAAALPLPRRRAETRWEAPPRAALLPAAPPPLPGRSGSPSWEVTSVASLQDELASLRDRHAALQSAAREEIAELRLRLREAHLKLGEGSAARLVASSLGLSLSDFPDASLPPPPPRRWAPVAAARRFVQRTFDARAQWVLASCFAAWRVHVAENLKDCALVGRWPPPPERPPQARHSYAGRLLLRTSRRLLEQALHECAGLALAHALAVWGSSVLAARTRRAAAAAAAEMEEALTSLEDELERTVARLDVARGARQSVQRPVCILLGHHLRLQLTQWWAAWRGLATSTFRRRAIDKVESLERAYRAEEQRAWRMRLRMVPPFRLLHRWADEMAHRSELYKVCCYLSWRAAVELDRRRRAREDLARRGLENSMSRLRDRTHSERRRACVVRALGAALASRDHQLQACCYLAWRLQSALRHADRLRGELGRRGLEDSAQRLRDRVLVQRGRGAAVRTVGLLLRAQGGQAKACCLLAWRLQALSHRRSALSADAARQAVEDSAKRLRDRLLAERRRGATLHVVATLASERLAVWRVACYLAWQLLAVSRKREASDAEHARQRLQESARHWKEARDRDSHRGAVLQAGSALVRERWHGLLLRVWGAWKSLAVQSYRCRVAERPSLGWGPRRSGA